MNLGGSLHTYIHLCVALGMWMTLSSAPQSLTWLSIVSTIVIIFNYYRGWKKPVLPTLPVWALLIICSSWLWFDQASLESLIGVITLLALSRLLSARRSHEYNQLLLLTFGQVLFASTLEFEISFGITLIIYMISITTALTLNHLHGEIEYSTLQANLDDKMSRRLRKLMKRLESKRLIDQKFLLGVGAISTLLCLSAILLFFIFPRVGGQWYQGYQVGPTRSGFSGDITLGGLGDIQLDDRVAFRALIRQLSADEPLEIAGHLPSIEADSLVKESRDQPLGSAQLYWAGRTLDHYEFGRWTQTPAKVKQVDQLPTRWINVSGFRSSRKQFTLQHFYLDSRGHETLFHLGQVAAVSLPMSVQAIPLRVTKEGDLLYDWPGDLHYAVLSLTDQSSGLKANSSSLTALDLKKYLQVPDSLVDPLKQYARQVVGEEKSPLKVAQLLEWHLRNEFTYRLQQSQSLDHNGIDPVLHFLQTSRTGHCEYFSSALTLLLRVMNIPAKQITGYAGGEWSELGAYYVVRQKDAHAWVEMLSSDIGSIPQKWIRLDPTPERSNIDPKRSLMTRIKRYRDHIQFLWFRYVLGFDARDQMRAVRQTRKTVKYSVQQLNHSGLWRDLKTLWQDWKASIWIGGVLIIVLIWSSQLRLWILTRYKRSLARLSLWWYQYRLKYIQTDELEQHGLTQKWKTFATLEVSRLYERALQCCESIGLEVLDHVTGDEIAQQLEEVDSKLCVLFKDFYVLYLRLRFSKHWTPLELDTLSRSLRHFESALKKYDSDRIKNSG